MEFLRVYYEADEGGTGGSPAQETTTETTTETATEVEFSPEQQAAIEKIIARVQAQEKRRAEKKAQELEKKAQEQSVEKDAEIEAARNALEKEKAELIKEKQKVAASLALAKEGFTLDGDDNNVLVGMVSGDDYESRVVALKKLIDAKVAAEVNRKLGESAHVPNVGKTHAGGNKLDTALRSVRK